MAQVLRLLLCSLSLSGFALGFNLLGGTKGIVQTAPRISNGIIDYEGNTLVEKPAAAPRWSTDFGPSFRGLSKRGATIISLSLGSFLS